MKVMCCSPDQMKDWNAICKAFAKKINAKLLFVNESSMGLEFSNGTFQHMYIEDLVDYYSMRGVTS